jgi:predicted small metal-binding protein
MAGETGEMNQYKELSCTDFRLDCDYTVRSKNADEILEKCEVHACDAHGKCGSSPEIREKIKSRIRAAL